MARMIHAAVNFEIYEIKPLADYFPPYIHYKIVRGGCY